MYKFKDLLKLINITLKDNEKRTQKIPVKELHKSKVKVKKKQTNKQTNKTKIDIYIQFYQEMP